jgi:hypothetical protein
MLARKGYDAGVAYAVVREALAEHAAVRDAAGSPEEALEALREAADQEG